jgi:chromosome segregation ATPase
MSKNDLEYKVGVNVDSKDLTKLNTTLSETDSNTKKVDDSTEKLAKEYKSLKLQLREATLEQQKLSQQFGSTSAEATKAAKAVANIKDEIGFQKDLVKSYNPDEKFRGLTQTAGLAALALGGVKDGFTALGIESKVLDQIIGSAQAILGVTSAVAGVTDAYNVLVASKKAKSAADLVEVATTEAVTVAEGEATVATWSWNAALLANPIVLITAGIVAAIAVIYAFIKITGDAQTAEEKLKVSSMQLTKAINDQARSFDNSSAFLSKYNNHKIALLQASGASEAAIYAETKALAEQNIQLAKNYRSEALRLEQKAYEANRSNPTEFNEKTLADAQENLKRAQEAVGKGYDELIDAQNKHEIDLATAKKKAADDANAKAEKDRADELARQKKHNEDLLAEAKRAAEDLANFKATVVRTELDLKAQKLQDDRDNIQRQNDEIAKQEEEKENIIIENDRRLKEKQQKLDEEDRQRRKANAEATLDLANAGFDSLANLTEAFSGKSKKSQAKSLKIQGAVNVSQIGANTAAGVMNALGTSSNTYEGTARAIAVGITGATQALVSVKNTSKALAALGEGGGAGSGGSESNQQSAVSPQIGFQNSSENQIASTIAKSNNQQNIKVSVLASDITDAQDGIKTDVVNNSF